MTVLIIILISIALQFAAAVFAVQTIRITGVKHAWILLCGAFVLMIVRRFISFKQIFLMHQQSNLTLANEAIGLTISLLMLLGVWGIKVIFRKQQQNEMALRDFDKLRMCALQDKFAPHFLFNTLNTIAFMIAEKKEGAVEAVHKLSDIYRFVVELEEFDPVALNKCLSILQSYFDIKQLRHGSEINLAITVDGDMSNIYLPGLTLQPIVENSIKHGFMPKGGIGKIKITVKVRENDAIITIADDGVGCDLAEMRNGYGLRIVRARLELCFGKRFSMEMSSEKGNGTTTIITVPVGPSAFTKPSPSKEINNCQPFTVV